MYPKHLKKSSANRIKGIRQLPEATALQHQLRYYTRFQKFSWRQALPGPIKNRQINGSIGALQFGE